MVALLAWAVDVGRTGPSGRAFPLALPLGAFALASLVSALAADDRADALASLTETLVPCVVFVAAESFAGPGRSERLFQVLFAGGTLAALVGLGQSLVHGSAYRIHGTFGHYMTFAGVLLTVSLVALARVLFGPDRRARTFALVALAVSVSALLMTHTRSAWLGWLAGAACASILWRRWALAALPAAALVLYLAAPGAVRDRIESIFDRKDVTAVERTYMWRSGTALWRDHFWLGVGPDNLRAAYPAYKLPDDPWLPERGFTHLHDNVLQIAGERGLLGLLAWSWIWLAWTAGAVRAWRSTGPADRAERGAIAASVAAIVGFHASGIFEYNFGNSEVVTLAWIVLAPVYTVERRSRGEPRRSARAHDPGAERVEEDAFHPLGGALPREKPRALDAEPR